MVGVLCVQQRQPGAGPTPSADNLSEAGKIYRGQALASVGGGKLTTEQAPEGFPIDIAVERPEEFATGLDSDLLKLVQATAELELDLADNPGKSGGGRGHRRRIAAGQSARWTLAMLMRTAEPQASRTTW